MSANRTELWGSVAFVAACTCTAFVPISVTTGLNHPMQSAAVATAIAVGADYVRRLHITRLRRKLEQSSAERQITVQVNNVRAGVVSEREYAQLELDTALDACTYVAQATNLAGYVVNCLVLALALIPIGLFWATAFDAWGNPQALVANVTALAQSFASVKAASGASGLAQQLGATFMNLLACAAVLIAGAKLSFGIGRQPVNEFHRQLQRRLVEYVDCPAQGEVVTFSSAPGLTVDDKKAGSAA